MPATEPLLEFTLDGESHRCPEGLTVSGALAWLGRGTGRLTPREGSPRSAFCGMGICFDCVMEIDGCPGVRACMTLLRPGMRLVTQRGVSTL